MLVCVTERRQGLGNVVDGIGDGDGARLGSFIEGRPLDVLHDHEELILQPKSSSEAGDVGMIQTRQYLDFANEPVREFRVIGKVGQ